MTEMTESRWRGVPEDIEWLLRGPQHDQKAALLAKELFDYAQSLRQENETLRLEFEGIDCEHRAKVMRKLWEDKKIMLEFIELVAEGETVCESATKALAEIARSRVTGKPIPVDLAEYTGAQQEQSDDS